MPRIGFVAVKSNSPEERSGDEDWAEARLIFIFSDDHDPSSIVRSAPSFEEKFRNPQVSSDQAQKGFWFLVCLEESWARELES
tara:strand:- start:216 stop:464 length:249 start_codon:yes stop_codon:yes gene_type:complete